MLHSCHTGSNDTSLESVALPGAESLDVQTNRQTDIFGYYCIDIKNWYIKGLFLRKYLRAFALTLRYSYYCRCCYFYTNICFAYE